MSLLGIVRTGLVGLACAAVMTGCTGSGTLPPRPTPLTTTTVAPPSSTPTVAFIDCGTFSYDQGERRTAATARCIVDATRTKRIARLIETYPSTEGAPITTKYVTNERGRIAVVTDSRQDPLGTHDVVLQTFRTTERKGSEILLEHRMVEVELWPPQPDMSLGKDVGILRPLEVERDCGFRSPLVDRPELHGLPLATVERTERKAGRTVRVIGQDGACNPATDDFRTTRTNVYLRQGLVAWAQMA